VNEYPEWVDTVTLQRKERETAGIFPCLECGEDLFDRTRAGYCEPCANQINN